MRWTPGNRGNVEDARGRSGGVGIPLGIGGVVVLLIGSWLTGVNLFDVVGGGGGATDVVAERPVNSTPEEEKVVDFVDAVTGDIQHTWSQKIGNYQPTRTVLFRDGIQSACGMSSAATGPFYCPGDRKVYLDLSFFGDLHQKLGAPGDFAQAYVVTHELGHHVQTLLGTNRRVQQLQQQSGPEEANALSVRLELQADCYAGVWGHSTAQPGRPANAPALDPDDVEEGLRAAAAIGDDRLQKMSGRGVRPESFTHGSSQQRVTWLKRGLETGDPNVCDTFGRGGTD
jgi:uncharacterized protein